MKQYLTLVPKAEKPIDSEDGLGLWLIIAGLFLARLLCAVQAGLVPDEAYYWLWSQKLALGYYDHPPMVAWLIAIGHDLFGTTVFGIRSVFLILSLGISFIVYDIAMTLFSDRTLARRAVFFTNISILIGAGSLLATPDTPSVFFYVTGIWALAKLSQKGHGAWWIVFGIAAGLGVEAKYTNFFLGICVLLWLWLDKSRNGDLKKIWFWIGALVALGIMAPNLYWNAQHDYITLSKQFGRIKAHRDSLKYLGSWIAAVVLMGNPFVVALSFKAIGAWIKAFITPPFDRSSVAAHHLLAAACLPIIVYLFRHAFHAQVQGNWAAPIFPILSIWAAWAVGNATGNWAMICRVCAAPFGVILCLGSLVIFASPVSPSTGLVDPSDMTRGWRTLAMKLTTLKSEAHADFIAVTHYSLAGELRRSLPSGLALVPMSELDRYDGGLLSDDKNWVGHRAVIVTLAKQKLILETCFTGVKSMGLFNREAKINTHTQLRLYTGILIKAHCTVDDPNRHRLTD